MILFLKKQKRENLEQRRQFVDLFQIVTDEHQILGRITTTTREKMNIEDYEQLETPSIAINMTAGALAGILEHCIMYPMDSVKVFIV